MRKFNWARLVLLLMLVYSFVATALNDITISALRAENTALQVRIGDIERKQGVMSSTINERTDPRWINEQLMKMFDEDIKNGNFN